MSVNFASLILSLEIVEVCHHQSYMIIAKVYLRGLLLVAIFLEIE
jgi:hypothetical protein